MSVKLTSFQVNETTKRDCYYRYSCVLGFIFRSGCVGLLHSWKYFELGFYDCTSPGSKSQSDSDVWLHKIRDIS